MTAQGRWPANVILTPTVAAVLDEQSGPLHRQDPKTRGRNNTARPGGMFGPPSEYNGYEDPEGSGASRFFLTAGYEPWELEWIIANGLTPCGE